MHTPGPWKTHAGASGQVHVMFGDDGKYIGKVDAYPVRTTTEDEANARLIASAPELLAACKQALAVLAQPATYPADLALIRTTCAAAIAHATQEPTP